ncbi:MAG: Ppx/GppA phosphatase family protein [Rhodoferax sp.]|uniref:Ppx/GppA phosphatase family protein n=1 Tax=Rhodoferax sp. TaxID=50421 RepID=UPI00261821EE|nr:Ppx/GppA phosphatase family protein [Rhodoferax sp.]MDD2882143.1 Ppx/GppA phosphatase family protein [Rhodoferax sp.]
MQNTTRLAAVDLGSNSFRLEIGRVEHGQFYRTEYLKETVRQGNGLDDSRNLTLPAMQRGWDCLARFGERLAGFADTEVRAVATQTLREARNRDEFLAQGMKNLGFPIDVISGREEARLIYQGVAQALPNIPERRLVIDIGGRSTEIILGQGHESRHMESYRVGSVTWSMRYFADNQFSKRSFQIAEIAAKAVLDEALAIYTPDQWEVAYGSAGTINAVMDVLVAAGWPAGSVTQDGLDWLLDKLLVAQTIDRLKLAGMREDRKAIIGGGLSVLRALFELLGIKRLEQATGGLRHGLLQDMLGSAQHASDLRDHSVQRLAAKFGADPTHGHRVGRVANELFKHIAPEAIDERATRKLTWAAQLHEIGSHISHSDSHKHGAYILDNTDAMGFALTELHKLSLLVLGHRGKLRKLEADFEDNMLIQQLLVLRMAVALCHARRDPDLKGITLRRDVKNARHFTLSLSNEWAKAFPQSAYLLNEESVAWQKTPWSLDVSVG